MVDDKFSIKYSDQLSSDDIQAIKSCLVHYIKKELK